MELRLVSIYAARKPISSENVDVIRWNLQFP